MDDMIIKSKKVKNHTIDFFKNFDIPNKVGMKLNQENALYIFKEKNCLDILFQKVGYKKIKKKN